MKILLIYPYCLEDRRQTEDISVVPIGVYYIGAFLKENNYDVEILNWYDINKTPQKIQKALIEKNPDIIGFSILHANRWGGIEIARIARQINPKVKIVFGGIGATFLWKHLLSGFKEIDFAVLGEGEYTFLSLVKCIERQDYKKIRDIKGLAYRENGIPVRTGNAELIQDLDQLPVPSKYFTYQHVSSTRGCPGNCVFCGSPRFWGHKVRYLSPDNFVGQLELLNRKGVTTFYFSDDTFILKKDRVIQICKKIMERGLNIEWVAISHVNYVDEEILSWMRKAGCIQISYGVESGSEKIRNVILKKKIKTDQIKKAFSLTTRYGIMARAYFIYGSPNENWSTIQETIDLIHEIKPLSVIFYILDIFPGTELYSDFKKRKEVSDEIWSRKIEDIMYFETDPDLSRELIPAFGRKLRTDFHEHIPDFVDSINLLEREDFSKMHSDFLSRLGMTFTHGDYSQVESIKEKNKIAERLYKRSLSYYPNHRAFLGLGIIRQKERAYEESINILLQGIEYFSDSEPLNMCLGVSCLNLKDYAGALKWFLKFKDSKEAIFYIAICYKALGDTDNEAVFLMKLDSFSRDLL